MSVISQWQCPEEPTPLARTAPPLALVMLAILEVPLLGYTFAPDWTIFYILTGIGVFVAAGLGRPAIHRAEGRKPFGARAAERPSAPVPAVVGERSPKPTVVRVTTEK